MPNDKQQKEIKQIMLRKITNDNKLQINTNR